jgi:hypothetical protein
VAAGPTVTEFNNQRDLAQTHDRRALRTAMS